ncbi:MAG: ROK family protein [Planctomycetia bacterium]|nr:ROK family protein [Planctomycetia bacterium]
MFLGIEIGGTKLQLGVGPGDGTFAAEPVRLTIDREAGAAGIRKQIAAAAGPLMDEFGLAAVGIGFGGPIDAISGRTITSHQVAGWDDFPLAAWCREALGLGCALGNDADLAALAEARFGAGEGRDPVFYVTVGTGIGGGFVQHGKLYHGFGPATAEIGHLRPGLSAVDAHDTVESIASGLGIERAAAKLVADPIFAELPSIQSERATVRITARELAYAAERGHGPSQVILDRAIETLGWAIAQTITLLAPQSVIVGGGVALMGETMFYRPLRTAVERYVFPTLVGTYEIAAPKLGEAMVVHGALALARETIE